MSLQALYYYSLPLLVFGIFSLLSLCLAFYIPETLDHPLLDTLEESEEFIKKNRYNEKSNLSGYKIAPND